jgi:uncharacterized protein involved in outer membrane biogenesis
MADRPAACEPSQMSQEGTATSLRWRLLWVGVAVALVAGIGIGVGEATGWPFLAAPIQRWLAAALDRRVVLGVDPALRPKVVIHLLGRVEISAASIEIGAPAWSSAPHMLLARDARMTLGYADLWRASRGAPLRIRALRAAQLDVQLERQADGRASWQFGKKTNQPDTAALPTNLPVFGRLQVDAGSLVYRDALMALDLDARFSLLDGSKAPAAATAATAATVASAASATSAATGPAAGLRFEAKGTYRKQPVSIDLETSGVLPFVAVGAATLALPVTIDARIGAARLTFAGTATDALHLGALKGRFSVQGPSLAAVGDPLRVTLPTTAPFHADGLIAKQGVVWNTVIDHASIGSSRLAGAFTYDPRPRLPLLAGRLTGTKLTLADLGPVVGAPVRKPAAPVTKSAAGAVAAPPRANAPAGRVLPDREFDLPSLRAMNANVLIDIDNLDLGSGILEPLRPLRTHLVLADGVLTLRHIEAHTGQGNLGGGVTFDGRNTLALWTADLHWDGVRLERWIHQARANGAPPFASGSLTGQARVAGQGRSTAAILASLRGEVRMQLVHGAVSHLAVEAAGLDIAQGLGVLIKGDDALPIQCAVADLVAVQGVLRPRVLVLETPESTIWMNGSISLVSEAIDLSVVVAPKDISPLALRTPLHVRGSFADPRVSLDKGKLGLRIAASALLGLVNPLAALIPLIDVGNNADAQRGADECRALSARIAAKPVLSAPVPAGRVAKTAPAASPR